jgi:hypothetical protein
VKVADFAPLGTVTVAGTCATDVSLLARVTNAPPDGADPFMVIVPVELFPPTTDVGVLVNVDRAAAATARVLVLVTPYVPLIVTVVLVATGVVLMVKVVLVPPPAMVTLAGTLATAVLLLDNVTTAPISGAVPVNVTVPVEAVPPMTLVGRIFTDNKVTAVDVKFVFGTLAPLTVIFRLDGVNVKPFFVGVTV